MCVCVCVCVCARTYLCLSLSLSRACVRACMRARGVPGVMPVIGFPDEGLQGSSAFPTRASTKCENRRFPTIFTLFHRISLKNRLRSSAFPMTPPPKPIGFSPFGRPTHRNPIGWSTPGVRVRVCWCLCARPSLAGNLAPQQVRTHARSTSVVGDFHVV
jgi:hypothetical protein